MKNTEITFYIASRWSEPGEGMQFTTNNIENVYEIAEKYKYSQDKIYVQEEGGKILELSEYEKRQREGGIENISEFWAFLERVKRGIKKTNRTEVLDELFEELSIGEKIEQQKLYNALSDKLEVALWSGVEDYTKKNPTFYIGEDSMQEFVPYLITMGEKRVRTFMKKPHLALKESQKEWEYPFEIYKPFLYFNAEAERTVI